LKRTSNSWVTSRVTSTLITSAFSLPGGRLTLLGLDIAKGVGQYQEGYHATCNRGPQKLYIRRGLEAMARQAVAVFEENPNARCELRRILEPAGFEILFVSEDAPDRLFNSHARLFVISNYHEDPEHAISLLRLLGRTRPGDPVFVLAWVSSERLAVAALKSGAADYFPPPIELQEVAAALRRSMAARPSRVEREAQDQFIKPGTRAIIGDSPPMRDLQDYVQKVAHRECNTLLLGETGTGKDLVAEAIHCNGPRRNKPFVCVNCAAIPDTLLESELFGHEKGAFTGAEGAAEGKIMQAHGGTIFFDEIGDMTSYAQAKILRVIELKQIQRLGGKASVPVNVRIIAATNQNLPLLISEQRFRKDLYFRLSVAQIQLPPLRDRRADIALLLDYYIGVFNRMTDSRVDGFTPQALQRLQDYDWPGNVRELRSLVESVFIDPPYSRIDECHLPWPRAGLCREAGGSHERDQLLEALQVTQWNKSKAAERLHWSRMKIYRKLAQYHIEDRAERVAAAREG
jgi:DNA-binding NtrC family response regulator